MRTTNLVVALVVSLMVLVVSPTFAQQDKNLFPGDAPPNQTRMNHVAPVTDAPPASASAWSRFLKPPQLPTFGMNRGAEPSLMAKWNASTKQLLDKTKTALTPPKMTAPKLKAPKLTPPKLSLPKLGGTSKTMTAARRRPKSAKKGNSFFSSWMLPKKQEAPPKPRTASEWIGLDRPE